MSIRQSDRSVNCDDGLLPLPLSQESWQDIAETLFLSPQQIRIVELLLRGQRDKEIAGLSHPTVRTYLKRIFDRVDVSDRVALILHIFAMAQQLKS